MKIVNVWLQHPIMQLNQTFSYFLRDDQNVSQGCRVLIELNNKEIVGFVDNVQTNDLTEYEYQEKVGYKVKYIKNIIDEQPVLNEELYQLGLWMGHDTISPNIACFNCMLPKVMKPVNSHSEPVLEYCVHLDNIDNCTTAKQKEIANNLKDTDMLRSSFKEIAKSVYQTLLNKEVISVYSKEKQASIGSLDIQEASYPLTDKQKEAIRHIEESEKDVILLHGVTGSGKTEIYMQLAKKTILSGKQVLILVPEISLTPQMTKRLINRFGSSIAIYHSKLNDSERYQQYQLVKNKQVSLVVGTRSAIFMPFDNLGLIILDEEHDHSYKQDSCPKYNCKDVAIWRGKYHHCKVIFGSATPTLESYSRALKNVYDLVTLDTRIYQSLPTSHLVNMEKEIRKGNLIISEKLKNALIETVNNHKQAILLLNRRGYNPVMKCIECGEVIKCDHCDMAMSYHKDENILKCHTCGAIKRIDFNCPNCGSKKFSFYGVGTQRLVEEIEREVKDAKVLRMDADTTSTKYSHEKILEQFENHEANILVGTQMIAKGLDYPDVTLVGILNADALLQRVDYRSVQTTFELIVQASGRSGRGKESGQVLVQSYDIDHYGIRLAVKQDYITFMKMEMDYRNKNGLPPFTFMIEVLMNGKNEEKVRDLIFKANDYFRELDYRVLGPANLLKKKDEYRYRLLLLGKNREELIERVWEWYNANMVNKNVVNIQIDVEPYHID